MTEPKLKEMALFGFKLWSLSCLGLWNNVVGLVFMAEEVLL